MESNADRAARSRAEAGAELESTAALLERVRARDGGAQERLFRRFHPLLLAWAHKRLPAAARDLAETEDLVQVVLVRAFRRIEFIEARTEAAFLAYLRTAFQNALRDELRRTRSLPRKREVTPDLPHGGPSILEQTIGRETHARYERALQKLSPEQRQAVILRVEFDYSHPQIAEAMGKPSADAARMLVARALVRLVEEMSVE